MHVTSTLTNDGNHFVECTCQIYNTIKCAGLSEIELLDGEDVVLDECLTCMHCRFYKDHLHHYREKLHNITSATSIENNIKASLSTLNNPIVVVATPNSNWEQLNCQLLQEKISQWFTISIKENIHMPIVRMKNEFLD